MSPNVLHWGLGNFTDCLLTKDHKQFSIFMLRAGSFYYVLSLMTETPGLEQAAPILCLGRILGCIALFGQTSTVCHGRTNSGAFPDGPAHVLSVLESRIWKVRRK